MSLNERAYIGALMHLPAERVIEVSTLVAEDDIEDPRLSILYAGILWTAQRGEAPTPPTIEGHLRTTGLIASADRAAVTALLVDLYAEVPIPAAVESYAREVLGEAVRRRVLVAAERLRQAAEGSPVDGLTKVVADEAVAAVVACKRLEVPPLAVVA